MRAWDLAIFIIMVEMCIGFLGGIGYYTDVQLGHSQGGEIHRFQTENMSETLVSREPSIGDYLKFALDWVFASFNMMITIIRAFLFISYDLYNQFHLPMPLCVFVQGIVYLIYTWGFIQWRSGRGGKAFE